jgi:hypothetical protein
VQVSGNIGKPELQRVAARVAIIVDLDRLMLTLEEAGQESEGSLLLCLGRIGIQRHLPEALHSAHDAAFGLAELSVVAGFHYRDVNVVLGAGIWDFSLLVRSGGDIG